MTDDLLERLLWTPGDVLVDRGTFDPIIVTDDDDEEQP